jgi:uncharacterized membrane protein YphA (DoxX/SURF4 family)
MAEKATQERYEGESVNLRAGMGLAIVRLTIGAMFVWVFFENLGKGLYTPAGYAGLINYYITKGHAPAAWKAVMALAANNSPIAAPAQGVTEISLGILLMLGLLTRPALGRISLFLGSLWISVGHVMDLGTAGAGAFFVGACCGLRGACLGRGQGAGARESILAVVVTYRS